MGDLCNYLNFICYDNIKFRKVELSNLFVNEYIDIKSNFYIFIKFKIMIYFN